MKLEKILIGTKNKAKLEELRFSLKELEYKGVEILDLNKFEIIEPEENGNSFYENALIKATYYSKITNLPTICDDGGIVIPYLGGFPGVKSKRWLGYDASDDELINFTLLKMKDAKDDERIAFLTVCVYFHDPINNISIFKEESIEGIIANEPSKNRIKGYPYRSLFIVKEIGKYYDELTPEEHEKVNHRIRAVKKVIEEIKKYYDF